MIKQPLVKNMEPEGDLNNLYGVVFPKGWEVGEKLQKWWYKNDSNEINSDKKKGCKTNNSVKE